MEYQLKPVVVEAMQMPGFGIPDLAAAKQINEIAEPADAVYLLGRRSPQMQRMVAPWLPEPVDAIPGTAWLTSADGRLELVGIPHPEADR